MSEVKHMAAPCKQCPFRRDSAPGYLGGSPPEKFVAQAFGPFVLPCHQACDFDDPEWRGEKLLSTPQCAGAAIYRANTGIAPLLPKALHALPANFGTVFSSPYQFMEHHTGWDQRVVRYFFDMNPLDYLLRKELASKKVKHYEIENGESVSK